MTNHADLRDTPGRMCYVMSRTPLINRGCVTKHRHAHPPPYVAQVMLRKHLAKVAKHQEGFRHDRR